MAVAALRLVGVALFAPSPADRVGGGVQRPRTQDAGRVFDVVVAFERAAGCGESQRPARYFRVVSEPGVSENFVQLHGYRLGGAFGRRVRPDAQQVIGFVQVRSETARDDFHAPLVQRAHPGVGSREFDSGGVQVDVAAAYVGQFGR